jgi:DNA-binding response OmpR family regulator
MFAKQPPTFLEEIQNHQKMIAARSNLGQVVGQKNFLVISGNATTRKTMALDLISQGQNVYNAASGIEGIRLISDLEAYWEEFDFVLLDADSMPSVLAIKNTCSSLREHAGARGARIAIIVFGARLDMKTRARLLDDTIADDVIPKSFTVAELILSLVSRKGRSSTADVAL